MAQPPTPVPSASTYHSFFFAYYGGLTYNAWMNLSGLGGWRWVGGGYKVTHRYTHNRWLAGRYGHKPTGTDTRILVVYSDTRTSRHPHKHT